ncbi:MAG: hypothetical protein Q7J16_10925 [Candidatus Cloacimonadales bacterium]|nr:hypothetical protein [Candidatus Cloacimonadales bacterium]
MSIIKNIFGKKAQSQPHNFSRVMQKKEYCVAFLPDDYYQDFEIISNLAGWDELFANIVIFSSTYNFAFYKKLQNAGKIQFRIFEPSQPLFQESVILNFSASKDVQRYLNRSSNSTIADINNLANMQFLPEPKDAKELLANFAKFYNISLQKKELTIELSPAEQEIIKQKFIQNRFPNFVFDCAKLFSARMMESYVKSFKQNFSANVYLTDKTFVSKEMINIEDKPVHNLYELFSLAATGDLFITTKPGLAKLLGELGYFVLLLGDETGVKNVRSVPIKELFTLKNIIQFHLKEKKEKLRSE